MYCLVYSGTIAARQWGESAAERADQGARLPRCVSQQHHQGIPEDSSTCRLHPEGGEIGDWFPQLVRGVADRRG